MREFKFISACCVILASLFLISCESYDSDFDYDSLIAECGSDVTLSNDDVYLVAKPSSTNENAKNTGFIFYPGALVSYEAYLPLMVKIAKYGYTCIIVQVPNNFAILNINAADRVINRYTEIQNWIVGGHSLGGAMAANYVSRRTGKFKGLVLLAAYSTDDISNSGVKVLSVYGSNDGVLQKDKYNSCKANLPSDFTEDVITGGNHAGFANYGFQSGDNAMSDDMTADKQQTQTAEDFDNLFSSLS